MHKTGDKYGVTDLKGGTLGEAWLHNTPSNSYERNGSRANYPDIFQFLRT